MTKPKNVLRRRCMAVIMPIVLLAPAAWPGNTVSPAEKETVTQTETSATSDSESVSHINIASDSETGSLNTVGNHNTADSQNTEDGQNKAIDHNKAGNGDKAGDLINIDGQVVDEHVQPLIGASVKVKGSSAFAVTDINGYFRLNGVAKGATLAVSMVGYTPRDIIARTADIMVVMYESSDLLDEMVVIGYGKQKKSNVTGSIVSIDAKKLVDLPTDNVTNMLAGKLPGLVALQNNGQPGESSTIYVRGFTTTSAGNSPIFIIDGVQRDIIDNLSPDEIESITVLKDAASTAIYGVQGGCGVILITTKRGVADRKPTVSLRASLTFLQNTSFPKFLNAMDYMQWHNKARELDDLAPLYTPDIVDKVMAGTDGYGQTDWFDEVFSGKGITQNYTLSVSGGSKNSKYFISGGYTGTDGIVKNVDYKKYSIRSNIDTDITNWLKLGVDIAGYRIEKDNPANEISAGSSGSTSSVFWQATIAKPIFPVRYDDVYSIPTTMKGNYNPVAALTESGFRRNIGTNLVSQATLDITIPWVKGLGVHLTAAYDYHAGEGKTWKIPYRLGSYDTATGDIILKDNSVEKRSKLTESRSTVHRTSLQPSVDYDNTFGRNHIYAQVVFDQYVSSGNNLAAGKMNFEMLDIPELSLGSDEEVIAGSVTGSSSKLARQSFIGRINYSWDDKYLLNFIMRADASVKFHKDHRWGWFPGASVGWRMEQEPFMEPLRDWLSNLKLRASFGLTGNDAVSNWIWMRTVSMAKGAYVWNGEIIDALVTGNPPAYDIGWEKTRTYNAGFEASFLHNTLNVEFDYYYKYTWDILQSVSATIPPSLGGNAPSTVNRGKTDNRGFETVVGYNKSFGKDWSLNVSGNVAYNHSRIIEFNDAANIPEYSKKVGNRIGARIGLVSDGLFKDEHDLATNPKYNKDAKVGDIKYKDLNGDGKIDIVNDSRIISDGVMPKWNYGLTIGGRWKIIDISAFFQGAAGHKVALQGEYASGVQGTTNFTKPFAADGNTPYFLVENSWTPENPNAEFPRLTTRLSILENAPFSDFWLRDCDYLRLKNMQIGVTLTKNMLGKSGIENIRVYVSGSNLLTISKLNKYGLDPEAPSVNNGYYPQQRMFTVGLNLTL